jgi:hypothetical protein
MSKPFITSYWVTCPKFTCLVDVNEHDVIVGGAPIVRQWIGKKFYKFAVDCGIDGISVIQVKFERRKET